MCGRWGVAKLWARTHARPLRPPPTPACHLPGDASWTAVDTERCLFAADLEARGGSGGDGGDRAKKGNAAAEPGSKRPAAGKAAKAKHPAGSSGKAAGGGDSGAGQAEVGASEGARPKRRKAE